MSLKGKGKLETNASSGNVSFKGSNTKTELANQINWWEGTRLLTLMSKVNEAVVVLNRDGMQLFVSPVIEKITGYSPEELQIPFPLFIHPDDLPHVMSAWQKGLENPEIPITAEYRYKHKNGGYVWLEASGTNYFDDPGIRTAVVTVRDISKRKTTEAQLRQSEALFSKVFNNSQLFMCITDFETGEILNMNEAALKSMGWTRDEIIGRTTDEVKFWPASFSRKEFIESIQNQGEHPQERNFSYLTKNGNLVHFQFTSEIIQEGEKLRLVSIGQNSTERTLTLNALQESERRLATLMKNLPGMAYRCSNDSNWTISFASEGAYLLTGYRSDELMENKVIAYNDLILPKYRESVWKEVQKANKAHEKFQLVYEIETATKEVKWVWEQGQALYNESGEVIALEGFIADITENKKAQEAILESEEKYRSLVTQSPDGIFVVNLDGKFVSVNESMCTGLNYTEEELLSMSIWDLVAGEYIEQHHLRLANFRTGLTENTPAEYSVKNKFGELRWVEVVSFPYYQNKNLIGFQGIARDITDRKNAEKKLNDALEKARESDKLKTTFLATMSHELRTPLNAVIGFSELIDETTPRTEVLEYCDTINQSGKHLLNIVEGMFDIALIEAGEMQIQNETFDLNQVMFQVFVMMKVEQKKLNKSQLEFRLVPLPAVEPFMIMADKQKIMQILINLIKNSLKYSNEGFIHFGFEVNGPSGQMLKFQVSDSGIGIPENKKDIIFEIFRQVDDSHTRLHSGVGIGLSVVKKLTELLGGKIWVESETGLGSTFYVNIPFQTLKTDNSESEKKNELNKQLPFQNYKVLIVEDDEVNFTFLNACLRNTGLEILWAKNGQQALDFAAADNSIDLVLMDIKMPVMDGYEATKRIKQIKPGLKVIAQTAYAQLSDKQDILSTGFDGYIAKPIDRTELFNLLNENLNGAINSHLK